VLPHQERPLRLLVVTLSKEEFKILFS